MTDLIDRQAAIEALHMHLMYRMGTDSNKKRLDDWINSLPSAQGKPFNLPEIYIADGYDTIEGEDGNVGFGVYVPDENQIYVAGDVEGEIRARALLHEICHWVQAMCGRSFDEDEANEFSDIVYDALPSAQETHEERAETHACDLISRQAAIDALDVLCQEHRYKIPGKIETYSQYNEAWQDALDRAEGAIGILPSADAVEVVRCKDCKSFSHGYCKFHDAKFVREDGYCYWGERKNDHNTGKI